MDGDASAPLRRCSKCKKEQREDEFYLGVMRLDGTRYRYTVCKTCLRRENARRYSAKVGGITRPPRRNARGEYRCPGCDQYLARDWFRATTEPSRPVAAYCKLCERKLAARRKQRSWERALAEGRAAW